MQSGQKGHHRGGGKNKYTIMLMVNSNKTKLLSDIFNNIKYSKNQKSQQQWAFLYFIVQKTTVEQLKIILRNNNISDPSNIPQKLYKTLELKSQYIGYKIEKKKDLIFTENQAASLVFLRWLDMIHDKTIDMSFKNFLEDKTLSGIDGQVKDIIKTKFGSITTIPPYVANILKACVSPKAGNEQIKIKINTSFGLKNISYKQLSKRQVNSSKSTRARRTSPLIEFDFVTSSGTFEGSIKKKMSTIYGISDPTSIDVRSRDFAKILASKNNNVRFIPNSISIAIDQEGETRQLSALVRNNDNINTRWNIPALLDPGHKMLKSFGLYADLNMLLLDNPNREILSTYMIQPCTFNFKIKLSKNGTQNTIVDWMTLRWRVNTDDRIKKSFIMEHAIAPNSAFTDVTPVSKLNATKNNQQINTNNINNTGGSTVKKAAKHYGDFAQILQSINSTRESRYSMKVNKSKNKNSQTKCNAIGTGDGVMVGIYGLMAVVFHVNRVKNTTITNNRNNPSDAPMAIFMDIPDFRDRIYFYNQGFTNNNEPMENIRGGANVQRGTPGISNRSRGTLKTSGSANINNTNTSANTEKKNKIIQKVVKLISRNNSANITKNTNNNVEAYNIYGKIANYRKGGQINNIYTRFTNISNTNKINLAKKLANVRNKNDFMQWNQALNMAPSIRPRTPNNGNSKVGTKRTRNNNTLYYTANNGNKNNNNTNNTASSSKRPKR